MPIRGKPERPRTPALETFTAEGNDETREVNFGVGMELAEAPYTEFGVKTTLVDRGEVSFGVSTSIAERKYK